MLIFLRAVDSRMRSIKSFSGQRHTPDPERQGRLAGTIMIGLLLSLLWYGDAVRRSAGIRRPQLLYVLSARFHRKSFISRYTCQSQPEQLSDVLNAIFNQLCLPAYALWLSEVRGRGDGNSGNTAFIRDESNQKLLNMYADTISF